MVLFSYFRVLHALPYTQTVHICVHKEKFWHLKVSQTVVVVLYYTMLYIEESESRSVEEGGESKVACCQALCSPKAEKAYTQQTLCVCSVLIPRPFFTLFNLAVTYLYHFIVVLSEVAQLPGGKVLFFSFHFISSMVCFQLFFYCPPKNLFLRDIHRRQTCRIVCVYFMNSAV